MTPPLQLPSGFLWGAATSAHQVEGNNTASNWWFLENAPDSPLREKSGAAVDSYNRFPEDMALLANAGLDSYRFSLEWSRIEPERDVWSRKQLDHYRALIDTAHETGLTPVVTLHHFTSPQWFSHDDGWNHPEAVERFARYVEKVSSVLSDVPWVCTINEPNMIALMSKMSSGATAKAAADSLDDRPIAGFALSVPSPDVADTLTAAHHRAREILTALTDAKVGWTVSNQAFESTAGNEEVFRRVKWAWEDRFLEVSRDDDFVGVQSYTTRRVGPAGPLGYEEHERQTLTGWPNRPDALGIALRNTWEVTNGTPILVTENGIATADDAERIEYTAAALRSLVAAVADGVDVRGYLHWSALDNYEWGEWGSTFGLIGVDRATFERIPRPSLSWLGDVARAHRAEGRVHLDAQS